MKDYLEELRKRLVGKTIVAIDPPNAREALGIIRTQDGAAFRLHATDLGYWVEDVAGADGSYASLTTLLTNYGHHQHDIMEAYGFDVPEPTVAFADGVLTLTSPEGLEFRILERNLSEWEMKVALDPAGRKQLGFGAQLGNAWRCAFSQNNLDCPDHLRLTLGE